MSLIAPVSTLQIEEVHALSSKQPTLAMHSGCLLLDFNCAQHKSVHSGTPFNFPFPGCFSHCDLLDQFILTIIFQDHLQYLITFAILAYTQQPHVHVNIHYLLLLSHTNHWTMLSPFIFDMADVVDVVH
jgi:hypothetical protein